MRTTTVSDDVLRILSMKYLDEKSQLKLEEYIKSNKQYYARYFVAGALDKLFNNGSISAEEIQEVYKTLEIPLQEIAILTKDVHGTH